MEAETTWDLIRNPDWVIRRKDSLELRSERMSRHRTSVDFRIPEECLGSARVPLCFLRKAPGQFTRFDFEDETGRSLPLPTREDNVACSTELLVAAARDALRRGDPSLDVTPRLQRELEFIARERPDEAVAILMYRWPPRNVVARRWRRTSKPAGLAFPRNKQVLAEDSDFMWLLRALAYSSLVLVPVSGEAGDRRILKLSYDEEVRDLLGASGPSVWSRLAALGTRAVYRLGWRGYVIDVLVPYAGARSYHFELYAPEGLHILEAGLRDDSIPRVHGVRRRVHIYAPSANKRRTISLFIQARARARFTTGVVLTAVLVAAVFFASWQGAEHLAGRPLSAAPSLLLLFPGVLATYLAREEHPIAARMLRLSRYLVLAVALLAYVAAVRLALVDRQTTAEDIAAWFEPMFWVAVGLAGILAVSRQLPLPLSHWARRPFRALRVRARRPTQA